IALAEEGHTRPGEALLGTASHTCTAGAFNQFATGIGNTDAAFVMGTGKLLVKVPPTLRFVFEGEIPEFILAKDLILQIIGDIGVDGATYRAMEFAGEAVLRLSMEERMTLANMVIEAGGKNGIIACDETTRAYLRGRTTRPFTPVDNDPGARFLAEQRYDARRLEPTVARPHSPDNRALARELGDVRLTRAYIGSCTGGEITAHIKPPRGALHRRCLGGHRPHHRSAGAAPMTITGRVYVLGDNIDTDQIIPAEYLSLVPTIAEEYRKLGSYALAGLARTPDQPPFVPPGAMTGPYTIIVAGKNFGCGSSREHAPIALGAAGTEAVGAESVARIFFRDCAATGEAYH